MAAALLCLLGLLSVASAAPSFTACPGGGADDTFALAPLPYATTALEPAIDNETMTLHHGRHQNAYVTGINGVLATYPSLKGVRLSEIVTFVGLTKGFFAKKYNLSAAATTTLRNSGGGHWNHAFFWKTLTTPNTSDPEVALGAELKGMIASSFGNVTALLTAMRASGASVFGSGWTWLCYAPKAAPGAQQLFLTTTPNQDNPLMLAYTGLGKDKCTPILGADVWEHAYYIKYRNVRANYLAAWATAINWGQVQTNFELAKQGQLDALYCSVAI